MKLIIDTEAGTVTEQDKGGSRVADLYSPEGFRLITAQWLKVGWNEKYTYTFTWLGRPIIQLPDDMLRAQEVIWQLRPDVIVETGIAHGGSLVYYASLCRLAGKGRVIGVDVEIRPHNRIAIESHELFSLITLVDGSSVDADVVSRVKGMIEPGEAALVFLDSNHTKNHVLGELEAYHGLVTPGSYIVATDGIMKDLCDVPRGRREWSEDNPFEAAKEFVLKHPEFVIEEPPLPFSESPIDSPVTHWPGAWLRKRSNAR